MAELDIEYDEEKDVVSINGVSFHGSCFRDLSLNDSDLDKPYFVQRCELSINDSIVEMKVYFFRKV